MTTILTCKICVAEKGFRLSDKELIFETEEELFDHMEKVHLTPVVRDGETEEEAVKRFEENCQCPECRERRGREE
jgi:hypothetical protein